MNKIVAAAKITPIMPTKFIRPQADELLRRLTEPRRLIQSISGARQVGKTTLALHVAEQSKLPYHFASADEPTLRSGGGWIASQWEVARHLAEASKGKGRLAGVGRGAENSTMVDGGKGSVG